MYKLIGRNLAQDWDTWESDIEAWYHHTSLEANGKKEETTNYENDEDLKIPSVFWNLYHIRVQQSPEHEDCHLTSLKRNTNRLVLAEHEDGKTFNQMGTV